MDKFLRLATPLCLVALAALVWFERVLPGRDAFARTFGEDAVPRFVTGVLCIYVLVLVVERQRMESAFKDVLGAFRDFHARGRRGERGALEAAQREAVEILIAALDSPDAQVRQRSVLHLERLTGQQLGDDAQAWRGWLREQAGPSA